MVLHSNKLLGAPRLRLLRVRNDSCVIPKSFQDTIQVMFFIMFESQLNADGFTSYISDIQNITFWFWLRFVMTIMWKTLKTRMVISPTTWGLLQEMRKLLLVIYHPNIIYLSIYIAIVNRTFMFFLSKDGNTKA